MKSSVTLMFAMKSSLVIIVVMLALYFITISVTRKVSIRNRSERKNYKDPKCICNLSTEPILAPINYTDPVPESNEFLWKILNLSRPVPSSWDWRNYPERLGPVEDQFTGNCWAYGAAGLLEGLQYHLNLVDKSAKHPIKLSEQFMTECLGGLRYCSGWNAFDAIESIHKNGVATSKSYPVDRSCESNETCQYTTDKIMGEVKGSITKLVGVSGDVINQADIMKLVAFYGPVSVGIEQIQGFKEYKRQPVGNQIFKYTACQNRKPDHDILLVGYGTDAETKEDYWILRNSRGTDWGLDGYMYVQRREPNCSFFDDVTLAYFEGTLKLD